MDSEKLKRFIILYISLVMPAILMVMGAIYGVGILWYLLLISWLGTGLLLVFLPTAPEKNGQ